MPTEAVSGFLKAFSVGRVRLEASTHVALLYRRLVEEGTRFLSLIRRRPGYIAEARIKSDRVDSRAIAELVRLDALPLSYMPPREVASLRERVRRRAFLVRERCRLMVKIRSVLAYEGVKPSGEYGLFTRRGVEWLRGYGLGACRLLP